MRSAWASTPVTSSTASASGATGSPASTSATGTPFDSASYSSSRARSRADRRLSASLGSRSPRSPSRGRRRPEGSCSGQVLGAAGVDLDALALVDEQRHLHDEAGLEGGRLAGARHAVALDARLGGRRR